MFMDQTRQSYNVHGWFYLQKDHVMVSLDDLMNRYKPKVDPKRYKVWISEWKNLQNLEVEILNY